MAPLLRPGGWVLAEEGELCGLCYPPHREHLADPNTLAIPHIYFLAWGRKPG